MSTDVTYAPVSMTRFEMMAPPEWLKSVDDWRREQPDLPGRAEAIRRLVALALAKGAKKKS